MQVWQDQHLPACPRCAAHAIRTASDLQRVAQWVSAQIQTLTPWTVRPGQTQISLWSGAEFDRQFGVDVSGYARNHWRNGCHERAEISLRYGIPVAWAQWVMAHELGHVLVAQQHWQMASEDEEGFCQTLAYSVLQRSSNPQRTEVMQQEWSRQDRVYGHGLRQGVAFRQQRGWHDYQQSLCTGSIHR